MLHGIEGLEEDNGYVIVYTDGCCFNNGRSGAKAGIGVFFNDGHRLNVSEPLTGRATNQRAEIQAVIAACERAINEGVQLLQINTDSKYVVNCVTKWIHIWRRNDWTNARGNPVSNKQDIKRMMYLIDTYLHIKMVRVSAHSGIHGNIQADKLAKKGAARY
ncbi:ribonuclease H1-like [Leptopilina boulardi]|uniref:ribonuclease H1-like n=1 Tax=Leptopilina boulardi TaxID=63433 RepID=UPI0021F646D1|nr:ribonuclease H1-like [Leptopilina boulardi]